MSLDRGGGGGAMAAMIVGGEKLGGGEERMCRDHCARTAVKWLASPAVRQFLESKPSQTASDDSESQANFNRPAHVTTRGHVTAARVAPPLATERFKRRMNAYLVHKDAFLSIGSMYSTYCAWLTQRHI